MTEQNPNSESIPLFGGLLRVSEPAFEYFEMLFDQYETNGVHRERVENALTDEERAVIVNLALSPDRDDRDYPERLARLAVWATDTRVRAAQFDALISGTLRFAGIGEDGEVAFRRT